MEKRGAGRRGWFCRGTHLSWELALKCLSGSYGKEIFFKNYFFPLKSIPLKWGLWCQPARCGGRGFARALTVRLGWTAVPLR